MEYESIFLIKYYIITVIKKIGAFWPIFNKVKQWISHCIFKSFAKGVKGFFFSARELIFWPNCFACIYLLKSRGGLQYLDFVITTYSYPLV